MPKRLAEVAKATCSYVILGKRFWCCFSEIASSQNLINTWRSYYRIQK